MTEQTSRREAPEWVKARTLDIKGKSYLPAIARIAWFREEHPDWQLETCVIEGGFEVGFAVVRATVRTPEGQVISSGIKSENKAGWGDFLEKAETGACSRALALAGYGTLQAIELDEGTDRPADSPQPSHGNGTQVQRPAGALMDADLWEGPGQCPTCHAPEGKRHGRPCVGGGQTAQAAGR